MVARRENWDGEAGLVARIRAQLELRVEGEDGQTGRLGETRRMGGVIGQGPGGLDRLGSDIAVLKRRLQRLQALSPGLTGIGISAYVEALSSRSTAEVK